VSYIRGTAFFFLVLLAMGCTGFDLPSVDVSDSDAAGALNQEAGLPDAASDESDDAGPKSYVVSTLAGTGATGATDGPGSEATFNFPGAIAIGPDGSLYVTDGDANGKIRKIAADGTVSTYAGTGATGLTNGPCASASFSSSWGIAVDVAGNVYVADGVIRKIDSTCQVTTLAGGGKGGAGAVDGAGTAASFSQPEGLTLDASGNLYVADRGNNKIRKVDPDGNVTTVANLSAPAAITVDAVGTLYAVDDNYIYKIANGQVTTLAGRGASGLIDGPGTYAAFYGLLGITIDANGNLFVTDSNNNAVRKVTPDGEVTTIAGGVCGDADGPANTATFNYPWGIAVDPDGVIYVADWGNNKIRKITPVY